MPPDPEPPSFQNPFGKPVAERQVVVGLGTLLVSMVVFAVISLLLMFAARVPAIADSVNDLLGVRRSVTEGKPDRSTHLFMLLFCYTSPLMLMLWVSLLKSLGQRRRAHRTRQPAGADVDPLA